MVEQLETPEVLRNIDQNELVELGKALVRIPSLIGEETPIARWVASFLSSRGYGVELQERVGFKPLQPSREQGEDAALCSTAIWT